MRVYILRHGIAEVIAPENDDRQRELTDEGRKEVREVLKAARRTKTNPGLIMTSPYVRARQTARLAADVLGYAEDPMETEVLVPGGEVREVWNEVRAHRDLNEVMLVGHDPLFSSLMGYLLGSQSILVDMKKGALARIDFESLPPHPHGTLKWLLVPKLL